MANYAYIAASLDGFIATPEGGIDWLEDVPNTEESDFGFSDFLSRVNAILMGRITFDKVRAFDRWPYAIPVFVLSNTLKELLPDLEGKVEIVSGPIVEVIAQLGAQGFTDLYIDGGRVIQSVLREDLMDELIITWFPKLLGRGIPLFGELKGILEFSHIETEIIQNYLVKSRYCRVRTKDATQQGCAPNAHPRHASCLSLRSGTSRATGERG